MSINLIDNWLDDQREMPCGQQTARFACAAAQGPPEFLKSCHAPRSPDPALVKYARSVGLPDWRIFTKVVLPSAAPSIITGMRLAATYSFLMLVVSEMVGASSGLGYLIVNAQYLLSVHLLYVGVIVLALLGIASNWALVALERRLGAWRPDLQP